MSLYTVLDYLVVAAVVGLLTWRGLFGRPGQFLTWPMFSRMAAYRVEMRDATTGKTVNPWEYMLHIDYLGGPQALQSFLDYLRDAHGIEVEGQGVVDGPGGIRSVAIEASRVVVQ